jgi:hypothetical protein
MEKELKKRTKNLANHNAPNVDDEEGLTEDEKAHLANEKLLQRLYKAADIEHRSAVRFQNEEAEDEQVMD